jgi:hypothetical protein
VNELEEVTRPTPILDAVEARSSLVGGLLRQGARWLERIRRRRQQRYIDQTWHDAADEREDP